MTSIIFRLTYNKTIIRFGFCDIQNNQGLGKGYQPWLRLITLTLTLIILDITKTESNNCFIIHSKYFPVFKGVSPFRSLFFFSPKITQSRPQVFLSTVQ